MGQNGAFAAERAWRGIVREWKLYAIGACSLAVAFICLGAAILTVTNLIAVEKRWTQAGRVSVYLRDGASRDEVVTLKLALSQFPGVKAVRHVTSAQAQSEFGARALDDEVNYTALPSDAFPPSIEVEVKPEMTRVALGDMVAKLKQLSTVEDVETYQVWTDRLARVVHAGFAAAIFFSIIVFASVLAVVGSTTRLALDRRSEEITVMRLVGATDRYVRRPFLLEGAMQGAMGAAAAIAFLAVVFLLIRYRVNSEISAILGVDLAFLPLGAVVGLIALGASLGAVAAAANLRRRQV